MIEMELVDVKVEQSTNNPVIVLRPKDGTARIVPIFIGRPEAEAIRLGMAGQRLPRPMTHDLAMDIVSTLDAALIRVVVTELRNKTFYAELHLQINGSVRTVSSRSSDAVALAVRAGAPIFAEEEVVEEAAMPYPDEPSEELPADADELVDEFRRFIEKANPEDFA